MASLDLDHNHAQYQIRAYKPGFIQINEKTFTNSLIITPDSLIENWAPRVSEEITADSLAQIILLKPDVLLIGTGAKLIFLRTEIYGDLINHGLGVEIMDTSAACRTFNALSAENRRVVAALVIK